MTLGRDTDVFLSILSESRKMALNEQTGKTLIYNARTGRKLFLKRMILLIQLEN